MRVFLSIALAVVSGLSTVASPWIAMVVVAIVSIVVVDILISIVHCREVLQEYLKFF